MIYSNPFYIKNNGNGYSLHERDAICENCHKVIDRQQKYEGIDVDFKFSEREKKDFKHCPYCGIKLYTDLKLI